MKLGFKRCSTTWMAVAFIATLTLMPALVFPEETYKFERMWPEMQQPWYFYGPSGIAVDQKGKVYFSEMWGHCVQKFTSGGQIVTKWGRQGVNDGEFSSPVGLAISGNESIYVVDFDTHRIQRFTMGIMEKPVCEA